MPPLEETQEIEETPDAVQQEDEGQAEEVAETKPPPKDLDPNEEWDRVDFANDPPEKIQRRFNRLYAEEKRNQRALQQMGADNRMLLERLEALEKTQKDTTNETRLEQIEARRREAFENHDFEAFAVADRELRDFEREAYTPPVQKQQPSDDLSDEQQAAIVSWATEVNQDGSFKRPWAFPQHPNYNKAINYVIATVNDPDNADAIAVGDYSGIFSSIDAKMNPPQYRRSTPVLSGDHSPTERKGPQLSEDMKRVARMMFPGDKDPYSRYAAALGRMTR